MAYNAIDIAKKIVRKTEEEHVDNCNEPFEIYNYGRIVLSEKMIESVHKAEQGLTDGTCFTEEMFQARFSKWF